MELPWITPTRRAALVLLNLNVRGCTGSYNCSQNAWGRLWKDKDGLKITCTSYELGVYIVGESICQNTVLPVVVPSLHYESDDAVSIDGKVTKLGKSIELHFRRNPNMYHRDEFLKFVGESPIATDICKMLQRNSNREPVAVFFCSSSCAHNEQANKMLLGLRERQNNTNPMLKVISKCCQAVKILIFLILNRRQLWPIKALGWR